MPGLRRDGSVFSQYRQASIQNKGDLFAAAENLRHRGESPGSRSRQQHKRLARLQSPAFHASLRLTMVGIGSGSGQRSKADAAVHDAVDYSAERVMCGPRHWQLERNRGSLLA